MGKKGFAQEWKRMGKNTLCITEMKEQSAILRAEATELEPSANAVPPKSAEGTFVCEGNWIQFYWIWTKDKKVFSEEWEIAKQRHT